MMPRLGLESEDESDYEDVDPETDQALIERH